MRLYQKIILTIMGILTVSVIGVTVYGVKVYQDTSNSFSKIVHKIDRGGTKREKEVSYEARDPFSILLLGVDTGAKGRIDQGRSDTMMVVTVNPAKKTSTIVSLDRDMYTSIVGYGTYDKLNHAYAFGGVEMAMDSVENLLDIPIDHYVSINMQGLSDLIDAVGGIDVDNKYHFELDGVELQPGKQHLDGEKGLAYARFRKYDEATGMGDPEGDIGRQKRQREVITLILNKVMSLGTVSNYKKILHAVEKNTMTDLTWDNMLDIADNYVPAFDNIKQLQLEGEGTMINEIYYQMVGKNSLLKTQNTLKTQLGLPTNSALSTGDKYTKGYPDYMLFDDSATTVDAGVQSSTDMTGNSYSGESQESFSDTDANENYTADQGDYGY